MRQRLAQLGVATGVHYWPALHRQPPLAALHGDRSEPARAVAWSEQELSLPMFPELTDEELETVVAALSEALVEDWAMSAEATVR